MGKLMWSILGVLFGIFLVAGIVFMVSQSTVPSEEEKIADKDCETSPYLDITGFNVSYKSQTIHPSYVYWQNDVYKGTLTTGSAGTIFTLGDKVTVLATKSGALDKVVVEDYLVSKCASNSINFDMWMTSAPTLVLFNDKGKQLSDGYNSGTGGDSAGTNVTSSASSITITARLYSGAKASIDPIVLVVEFSNQTQIEDITLQKLGTSPDLIITELANKPKFHTSENTTTSSYIEAFELKGVSPDGAYNEFTIRLDPADSMTMGNPTDSVYVTAYVTEPFVDTDGSLALTGAQDSAGTNQTENSDDYDFCIDTA